jgi:YidC/Oxa1 family membrane protein insertase
VPEGGFTVLAPVELTQHLLTFLDTATRPLLGASSAWVAIALLTLLVRVAMLPLAIMQFRAARAQLELQPEIAALRKRHAKRPERLQAAVQALYRERGVSMFAGCLPLLLPLVQVPVMWVVYRVVRASAFTGALFGVPLGTSLLAAPPLLLLALVGVLTVAATLSAWQAGRAQRRGAPATAPAGHPAGRQAATLARVLPFAVIPVALWLPLAVVVYLSVGNLFTVVQQVITRVH